MKLTGTKTENFEVDASPLVAQINEVTSKVDKVLNNNELPTVKSAVTDLQNKLQETASKLEGLESLSTEVVSAKNDIEDISNRLNSIPNIDNVIQEITNVAQEVVSIKNSLDNVSMPTAPRGKFEFVLERNGGWFGDGSWENILKAGQEIQKKYWKEGESYWRPKYPGMFEGWHGSAVSPVIKILCEEPEYFFKNTCRLPGRFQLSSTRRWSSVLRFYGDGDKVLKDTIGWGHATYSPIGIYVESKTHVGDMIMNPFEQTIDEVILCAMNGSLPVYLANNQDRFAMRYTKILQHNGSLLGVKHGPVMNLNDYPFPAVQSVDGSNTYLTDPNFEFLQLEGPHSNKRPQAAMLLTGNNIILSNLNLYGWMQGPYIHGGKNVIINGLTHHSGLTSSGRRFCADNEIVSYTICQRSENEGHAVAAIGGAFQQLQVQKRSLVKVTGGWHSAGQYFL